MRYPRLWLLLNLNKSFNYNELLLPLVSIAPFIVKVKSEVTIAKIHIKNTSANRLIKKIKKSTKN